MKAFYKIKLKQVEKINKQNEKEANEQKIEADPIKVFTGALDNIKPLLKLMAIKKGGITYQCPTPLSEKERESKAVKILLNTCLEKDKKSRFSDVLANEVMDAYENQVCTKLNCYFSSLLYSW